MYLRGTSALHTPMSVRGHHTPTPWLRSRAPTTAGATRPYRTWTLPWQGLRPQRAAKHRLGAGPAAVRVGTAAASARRDGRAVRARRAPCAGKGGPAWSCTTCVPGKGCRTSWPRAPTKRCCTPPERWAKAPRGARAASPARPTIALGTSPMGTTPSAQHLTILNTGTHATAKAAKRSRSKPTAATSGTRY
jgi:hypothetical protein